MVNMRGQQKGIRKECNARQGQVGWSVIAKLSSAWAGGGRVWDRFEMAQKSDTKHATSRQPISHLLFCVIVLIIAHCCLVFLPSRMQYNTLSSGVPAAAGKFKVGKWRRWRAQKHWFVRRTDQKIENKKTQTRLAPATANRALQFHMPISRQPNGPMTSRLRVRCLFRPLPILNR